MVKTPKKDIIKQFAKSEYDSGSTEVQIGLLTERIRQISEHLVTFPKDLHSRRGLIKIVGKRNSLIRYLRNNDAESHSKVMQQIKS